MIQRLEDNERRQNVLIHRLSDKIESLAPPQPLPEGWQLASPQAAQPSAQPHYSPAELYLPESRRTPLLSWTPEQQAELARQMKSYTMFQLSGMAMTAPQPSPSVAAPQSSLPSVLSPQMEATTQQSRAQNSQPTNQQLYYCNDCRYRCKHLRNLDQHIATKHQRPHHIPDLTLLVGDSQMKTVNCRKVEAALGGGKLVCGEHVALRPPGRRSPRAGKPGRAYNSVSSWPGAKYPESSLETVVPQLLRQANSLVTTLVVQARPQTSPTSRQFQSATTRT